MKKCNAIVLVFMMLFLLMSCAFGESDETKHDTATGADFITIREWLEARGECGDCMLLVRIKSILNPVLAVAEDETGTVNLFSANGEDNMIVNFMGDEGLTEGSILVIANPHWNEYEGTIEMAEWTILRLLPVLVSGGEE